MMKQMKEQTAFGNRQKRKIQPNASRKPDAQTDIVPMPGNQIAAEKAETAKASACFVPQTVCQVFPGNGALQYHEVLTLSLELAGNAFSRGMLDLGGQAITMNRIEKGGNTVFSVDLPAEEILGNEKCGCFSYCFAIEDDDGLCYVVRDLKIGGAILRRSRCDGDLFCCAVYRRFLDTPDWLKGGILLALPPMPFSQLILRMPDFAQAGVSCLGIGNAFSDHFGKLSVALGGENGFRELIAAGFEQDISIICDMDFGADKTNILGICRGAVQLLEWGCGGFFVRNTAHILNGFLSAMRYHVRQVSSCCVLLGDEETPLPMILGEGLDARADMRISEALRDAVSHKNAAVLARTLSEIYQLYLPPVSALLPVVCEGTVPDWMRILQYTLPGLVTLLDDRFTPLMKRLGELRRQEAALATGEYTVSDAPPQIFLFTRSSGGQPQLTICVNLSASVPYPLPIRYPVKDLITKQQYTDFVPVAPGSGVIVRRLHREGRTSRST